MKRRREKEEKKKKRRLRSFRRRSLWKSSGVIPTRLDLLLKLLGCVGIVVDFDVEILVDLGLVSGCVLSFNPFYVEGYDDP
uniref:Uncharacterized protein n=1 Tax=Solanum tuberosum TaxID=4113 RepID=M0ZWZ4_SOLTU